MAKSARGWLAQVYLTRLQGTFGLRRESAITGVCWEAWRRGWTLHRAQLLDAITRSHKLYFIKIWWRWRLAVQVSLHFRLCERHAELKDRTSCLRRCVLGWSTPLAARIAEAHFLLELARSSIRCEGSASGERAATTTRLWHSVSLAPNSGR